MRMIPILLGLAFVTMAFGVNARTAFSLFFPPLLDEFGWDRGVTAGAFSFGFLVSAVMSPTLGRLMDDWLKAIGGRPRVAFEPFAYEALRAANRATW